MQKKTTTAANSYRVIGLMSGTSLDGLDIVLAEFQREDKHWSFKLLGSSTFPYPDQWKKALRYNAELRATDLAELDATYGKMLAIYIHEFLVDHPDLPRPDLIASHGHTLFHQPQNGYSLQIGSGHHLNFITRIPVVSNFRYADVVAGGQGAPLVPIGDRHLFGTYQSCLNLGGFANISFEGSKGRLAFDICPVNYVLNSISAQLGLEYDAGGSLAERGRLHQGLLHELNALPFYGMAHPKSLGAEWVEKQITPLLQKYVIPKSNILHTFNHHIAEQISRVFVDHQIKNCLCTGGGTFNHYLMRLLRERCETELIIPDDQLINYKEALIFAFMGVLRVERMPNVLASVTGAPHDHCSGDLHDHYQNLK